jgi:hypothetical protein
LRCAAPQGRSLPTDREPTVAAVRADRLLVDVAVGIFAASSAGVVAARRHLVELGEPMETMSADD